MKARTWKHNFVNMIGMTHEYGILEGLSSEVVIILVVVLCYLGLFSIFAKFMTLLCQYNEIIVCLKHCYWAIT
jgi:hypothetical protein